MSEFHERLKELRCSKALTQESFAKIGGVTINTQVNYEKGERFPNADYLMRLAKEDFDVNYLLTGKRIRNKLHFEQGQLLDFYDEANTDVRAAVFDLFMIEQSGEPLRQTLLYRQNVLEYLTGHRKYGELSQEEMELLHLWHKTPWHMRKAVLNMLATDWFEEEPKNYKAEDNSGGSSSQGGDSGGDSETITALRRDKDDDVVAVKGCVATGDEGLAHIDSRLGVSQVRIVASTVAGFQPGRPGLPVNAAPGGDS